MNNQDITQEESTACRGVSISSDEILALTAPSVDGSSIMSHSVNTMMTHDDQSFSESAGGILQEKLQFCPPSSSDPAKEGGQIQKDASIGILDQKLRQAQEDSDDSHGGDKKPESSGGSAAGGEDDPPPPPPPARIYPGAYHVDGMDAGSRRRTQNNHDDNDASPSRGRSDSENQVVLNATLVETEEEIQEAQTERKQPPVERSSPSPPPVLVQAQKVQKKPWYKVRRIQAVILIALLILIGLVTGLVIGLQAARRSERPPPPPKNNNGKDGGGESGGGGRGSGGNMGGGGNMGMGSGGSGGGSGNNRRGRGLSNLVGDGNRNKAGLRGLRRHEGQ